MANTENTIDLVNEIESTFKHERVKIQETQIYNAKHNHSGGVQVPTVEEPKVRERQREESQNEMKIKVKIYFKCVANVNMYFDHDAQFKEKKT